MQKVIESDLGFMSRNGAPKSSYRPKSPLLIPVTTSNTFVTRIGFWWFSICDIFSQGFYERQLGVVYKKSEYALD